MRVTCFLALLLLPLANAFSLLRRLPLTSTEPTLYWCKCICFNNYQILPLYRPEDESKPCLTCTKQWCLSQGLDICTDASNPDVDPDTATGEEGDVRTKCFQRDSVKEQSIIFTFLVLTIGMLCLAMLKRLGGMEPFIELVRSWISRSRHRAGAIGLNSSRYQPMSQTEH